MRNLRIPQVFTLIHDLSLRVLEAGILIIKYYEIA